MRRMMTYKPHHSINLHRLERGLSIYHLQIVEDDDRKILFQWREIYSNSLDFNLAFRHKFLLKSRAKFVNHVTVAVNMSKISLSLKTYHLIIKVDGFILPSVNSLRIYDWIYKRRHSWTSLSMQLRSHSSIVPQKSYCVAFGCHWGTRFKFNTFS